MIEALVTFGASELITGPVELGSRSLKEIPKTDDISVTKTITRTRSHATSTMGNDNNSSLQKPQLENADINYYQSNEILSIWLNTVEMAYSESFWQRCITKKCVKDER